MEGLESRFTNYWASANYAARLITRTRRLSFAPFRQELRTRLGPLDDLRELLPLIEATWSDPAAIPPLREHLARRHDAAIRATATLHDAEAVRQAIAAVLADAPTPDNLILLLDGCTRAIWRWRWLKNQRRMYDVLEQDLAPLAIDHYFLCWPEVETNPDAIRQVLKGTFLLPDVQAAPLPALIPGRYREEATYLHPEEPGDPYLTVLTGWDTRGAWDLLSLSPLLMADYELALAIDIATLPRPRAQRRTTDAYSMLKQAVFGKYAVKDARSERALAAVNHTLSQLDVQNLHQVAYAVLLQAPSLPALERQAQTVRDTLGVRLRLDRVVGGQAEYLKLFTPLPSKAIKLPLVRRNTLSHGVAVKVPWGIRKTSRTSGTLYGFDPQEGMPIHYNIWGSHNYENAHLVMMGRPGSGKTVCLLMMAHREAVAGAQIVFFDPLGKCRLLCDAVGRGATYHDVQTDAAINILDPLTTNPGSQKDHVVRKLSIIMGRSMDEGGRTRLVPRDLDNFEIGAIGLALQHPRVYGPYSHRLAELTPQTAPLLEDLVQALKEVAVEHDMPDAAKLGREIEVLLLYDRAPIYNSPTTLRWDFHADVVAYDFQYADPGLLPLYYDHGFEALNAWVRSPERKRRRQPLIVIIDEFYYMAQVKALEAEVAMATKTWRNFRAAMWTADQNATTYFGQEGLPSEWGPFTANNTLLKFLFRQEASEADVLARAYQNQLSDEHIQQIKTSGTGECIALLGDETHSLIIQLTNQEQAFFLQT
jgi:hypothetical protein